MPVFGLTGNLASGKSTVLEVLKNKGAIIFDADKQVHSYYKNRKSGIYKKISLLFPQCIKHGSIDRKILGGIVFSDAKKLKILEKLVHGKAIEDLKAWIKRANKSNKIHVAEVQLLFEKRLEKLFDATILVYAPEEILLKRIENNLGLSQAMAAARLELYWPVNRKIKRADFIINNNSNIRALRKKIDALWDKLTWQNKQ